MKKRNKFTAIVLFTFFMLAFSSAHAYQRYWTKTVIVLQNKSTENISLKLKETCQISVSPKKDFIIKSKKEQTLRLKYGDPWFWQTTMAIWEIFDIKKKKIGEISGTFDEVSKSCIKSKESEKSSGKKWSIIVNTSHVSEKKEGLVTEITVKVEIK